MNLKSLWNMKSGEKAVIESFHQQLSGAMIQRLNELGIHCKREVKCLKQSFLGSPKSFAFGDTVIGLDKEVADLINVIVR